MFGANISPREHNCDLCGGSGGATGSSSSSAGSGPPAKTASHARGLSAGQSRDVALVATHRPTLCSAHNDLSADGNQARRRGRSPLKRLRLLLRVQVGQRQVAPLHERPDILGAALVRVALEDASAVDGLKLGDGRLRRVEAE